MHVENTHTDQSTQPFRMGLSAAALALTATGLLLALLAPGRTAAAERASLERAAKPVPPAATPSFPQRPIPRDRTMAVRPHICRDCGFCPASWSLDARLSHARNVRF